MTHRTIHLHGAAAERFGGPYRLVCDTPRDALRALMRLKPGFRKFVEQADWRLIRGPIGAGIDSSDVEMLGLRFGRETEFHLIPVASGAGRGKGIGKAVAGIAIAAAAVVAAPFTGGASAAAAGGVVAAEAALAGGGIALGATAFLGITYANIAMLGIGLALSGVAQLLAPNPKVAGYGDNDHPENRPSFLFGAPVNTSAEGSVIPIVYGKRVRCGSVVGAAGIYVEDLPV